jgi:hypothetical protein
MDGNRIPQLPLFYKAEEHRDTGRPRIRWNDEFN